MMRYRQIMAGMGGAVSAGDEGAPGRGVGSFPDVEGSRSDIG
jgi:hypothetical protein